ncbi:MAG: hypothetical protein HYW50_00045 [Candidatus Diapherotrites archaeon]|nr:hypothetical protein [Candidatus Diapherotrites archaeon]
MNIVSVSLTEKNLSDLERLKVARGLENVSQAVRAAIADSLKSIETEKEFEKIRTAVLIASHSHKTEKFLSEAKHAFQKLVKSQNHYCTNGNECIDIFLLGGNGTKIKKMRDVLLKNKDIKKIVFAPL